jgi:putative spermidine/putrescine transport system ATP-binding protein
MTTLILDLVKKDFGSMRALEPCSLEFSHGQFICFLGPSGCGKTTLLRMIAGLERPSGGRILLDDQDITEQPAHLRNFGMVFQSLVLFPNMTIGDNVSYPLRLRRVPSDRRRERVAELLRLFHLTGREGESVQRLSGGERQRVAIARALAFEPRLLLLDEPFSALDAKLREELQVEIRLLQKRLDITTVMVTHDQREAMTMADTIVVMGEHRVQQVGPTLEAYRNPANAFVANFVGAGNLLPAKSREGATVELPGGLLLQVDAPQAGTAAVLVRPEHVVLLPEGTTGFNRFPGRVSLVRQLGATVETLVDLGGVTVTAMSMSVDTCLFQAGASVSVELPIAYCRCLSN